MEEFIVVFERIAFSFGLSRLFSQSEWSHEKPTTNSCYTFFQLLFSFPNCFFIQLWCVLGLLPCVALHSLCVAGVWSVFLLVSVCSTLCSYCGFNIAMHSMCLGTGYPSPYSIDCRHAGSRQACFVPRQSL